MEPGYHVLSVWAKKQRWRRRRMTCRLHLYNLPLCNAHIHELQKHTYKYIPIIKILENKLYTYIHIYIYMYLWYQIPICKICPNWSFNRSPWKIITLNRYIIYKWVIFHGLSTPPCPSSWSTMAFDSSKNQAALRGQRRDTYKEKHTD
jgi:hypothetical protein